MFPSVISGSEFYMYSSYCCFAVATPYFDWTTKLSCIFCDCTMAPRDVMDSSLGGAVYNYDLILGWSELLFQFNHSTDPENPPMMLEGTNAS